jgi:hypothetical protein
MKNKLISALLLGILLNACGGLTAPFQPDRITLASAGLHRYPNPFTYAPGK